MRTGCSDLPDPTPCEDATAAGGEPIDHHVEELLLAFNDLERQRRQEANPPPPPCDG